MTDKATPSPASVDTRELENALRAEVIRLAEQGAAPQAVQHDPRFPAAHYGHDLRQDQAARVSPAEKTAQWWCPHCREIVPPEAVTFSEHHDPDSGGCGDAVGEPPAEKTARMLTVNEFNVGRFCLSEDECIAQGIDFSAYERGIADASAAFSRNT